MGKAFGGLPEAAPVAPEGGAESIGRYLARQRRLRGITLDELSLATHIPRRSLERLEAGAFDGPPDGFARGFVRTVAAAIGLDPEEAVTRMLAESRPVRGPARRVPAALLLGLLGALVLAWLLASVPTWRRAAPAAAPPAASELPRRRDFVRELAEARRPSARAAEAEARPEGAAADDQASPPAPAADDQASPPAPAADDQVSPPAPAADDGAAP